MLELAGDKKQRLQFSSASKHIQALPSASKCFNESPCGSKHFQLTQDFPDGQCTGMCAIPSREFYQKSIALITQRLRLDDVEGV
jgi:hypothetical protein